MMRETRAVRPYCRSTKGTRRRRQFRRLKMHTRKSDVHLVGALGSHSRSDEIRMRCALLVQTCLTGMGNDQLAFGKLH